MEPDFSGWATKANIRCSDGRVILPNAFQHQDKMQVPLVWQHGHNSPENILGHVLLENRAEGVYAHGYFNETPAAQHAKQALAHKDINMMSIWANQLQEQAKRVMHGVIREVSLVLAGANPGAIIEQVSIRHSDGEVDMLDDEVLIQSGEEIELFHSVDGKPSADIIDDEDLTHAGERTVEEIFNSMTEEQKAVVYLLMGDEGNSAAHADLGEDATIEDVYNSMSEQQQEAVQALIGMAVEEAAAHSDINDDAALGDQEGNNTMSHSNIFEKGDQTVENTISHDDMKGIVSAATRYGSLKHAVEEYALQHGIENIDTLFPDFTEVNATPEWLSRRVEWVASFLGGTTKRPFAKIRTTYADITEDEARAKGYITGNLKKEEFFSVNKRTTSPTTVYKKQKLDRDDVIDITDFDVVNWIKGEMRLMLDEEVARAALIGDGRDISNLDKIDEQCIRPIAKDHELFTTKVYVNLDDASSSIQELIDAVVYNRAKYKGTGMPVFYTTETVIAKFLLLKDTLGRRLYSSLAEIATELRCSAIVPVEVMEEDPTIVGIMVNPVDYSFGTDRGGEVTMFDDFDIDYNNLKYLIETRLSGALTRLKAAICFMKVDSTDTLVVPTAPSFVASTGVITIPTVTGATYKRADTDATVTGNVTIGTAGASLTIYAVPTSGAYYFATSDDDTWSFTRDA
jgi:hypothetical protein